MLYSAWAVRKKPTKRAETGIEPDSRIPESDALDHSAVVATQQRIGGRKPCIVLRVTGLHSFFFFSTPKRYVMCSGRTGTCLQESVGPGLSSMFEIKENPLSHCGTLVLCLSV